jgi:3-oxoacyl-[acyl-carrier protein] reductase
MSEFSNKVAVVTGAGRGIGLAIAKRLADGGAKVAVISRTEASCRKAAEEINAAHPDAAWAYALDVADGAAVNAAAGRIIEQLGKVDILVNNAGVTRDGLSMRMSEEDWNTVLDTNLKGAFNTIQAFQRSLLRQKNARIINIASVIGLIGNAGQANYAASKGGLIALTKSIAREFGKRSLTVNAIAPGFVITDMTAALDEKQRQNILAQIPLGYFGAPEDIAHAVAFLASDGARYITGQVLVVDGGMVM